MAWCKTIGTSNQPPSTRKGCLRRPPARPTEQPRHHTPNAVSSVNSVFMYCCIYRSEAAPFREFHDDGELHRSSDGSVHLNNPKQKANKNKMTHRRYGGGGGSSGERKRRNWQLDFVNYSCAVNLTFIKRFDIFATSDPIITRHRTREGCTIKKTYRRMNK